MWRLVALLGMTQNEEESCPKSEGGVGLTETKDTYPTSAALRTKVLGSGSCLGLSLESKQFH